MNKNYYQILEVDVNASFEVIEKAYKTLVKKYHPDLQENSLKNDSEEKLKLINEAYEVLSNEEKRKNYDLALQQGEMEKEKIKEEEIYKNFSNSSLANNIEKEKENNNNSNNNNINYINQIEQARKQAYYDAYIQDLKNRGYKIRYKKTWKDYLKNIIAFFLTILVLFLLFQVPFIKNFLVSIYEENLIVKSLVSPIINLFN